MTRIIKQMLFPALLLLILLSSCGVAEKRTTADNTGSEAVDKLETLVKEKADELLTPKELYELTGLTAEDFTELDVNEFIKTNELTRDNAYWANSLYKAYFREETETQNEYKDEYSYLLNSPLKKLEEGMTEEIKRVYVRSSFRWEFMATGSISVLLDFENQKVFYDNQVSQGETKAEDREKLTELIKNSGLEKLKEEKRGTFFSKEGYEIIIESNDGRIAHYRGENTKPEEAERFYEGVMEIYRDICRRSTYRGTK